MNMATGTKPERKMGTQPAMDMKAGTQPDTETKTGTETESETGSGTGAIYNAAIRNSAYKYVPLQQLLPVHTSTTHNTTTLYQYG